MAQSLFRKPARRDVPTARSTSGTELGFTSPGKNVRDRRLMGMTYGAFLATLLPFANDAKAADQALPANTPDAPTSGFFQGYAVGLGVSTLGLNAEVSTKLNNWLVLRAAGGGYGLSLSHDLQGNSFSLQASMIDARLLADWHPFSNGFRVSVGPSFQDFHATGTAAPANGTTLSINGTPFQTSQIGNLHASITSNQFGGYFGIGYDAIHFSGDRFAVGFDLGGIYAGTPKTALTTDRSVPGLASNLAAAESSAQGTLKYLSVYPVLTITAKYRF